MASFDDVRRIALSLPETSERTGRGNAQWRVRDKLFVWERPLLGPDLRALGDDAVFFTTPHFDGYPAVLARLEVIAPDELHELIVEAWLVRAPKRLAQSYLADHSVDPPSQHPG